MSEEDEINAPKLTDDPVADALTELGILDGVDIDIATLRASGNRDEILSELKSAGVMKLGQRMKLLNLIQATPAPAPKPKPTPTMLAQPAPPQPPPPEPPPAAEPEWQGYRRPVPPPKTIPGLTPTNMSGDNGGGWYEVIPNAVKVRSSPTTNADNVIDFLKQRKVFEAEREADGWLLLKEKSEPGARDQWVLKDGAALGLGPLVKRVPASARWRDDDDEKLEDRVSTMMLDQWTDDM